MSPRIRLSVRSFVYIDAKSIGAENHHTTWKAIFTIIVDNCFVQLYIILTSLSIGTGVGVPLANVSKIIQSSLINIFKTLGQIDAASDKRSWGGDARRLGTSVMSNARTTAAATIAEILPPLPGMSPSKYPSSRESPLRQPLLSGIAAGRAV